MQISFAVEENTYFAVTAAPAIMADAVAGPWMSTPKQESKPKVEAKRKIGHNQAQMRMQVKIHATFVAISAKEVYWMLKDPTQLPVPPYLYPSRPLGHSDPLPYPRLPDQP